ncbi:hypothetical protein [Microbispora sp. NPDC049633]|uniref:hypothetical protein n=1 Tax=Microbispora sp. NPDC049633 TaxID=3154355 RepID=UPI0034488B38
MALTRAVWDDCVAWEPEDNARKRVEQDADLRLWNLLTATAEQLRRYGPAATDGESYTAVELWRIERSGDCRAPRPVDLYAHLTSGEGMRPVLTIKARSEA